MGDWAIISIDTLMKRARKQMRILLVVVMISWLESVNGQIQSSRFVYHTDGLGSVVAMTDSAQQTAKSYSYEAFGKIRAESRNALVINRNTYTAREALGDSIGLYYYRARALDQNLGRFTSEDGLMFFSGPNVYLYVENSPLGAIDPTGNYCTCYIAVPVAVARPPCAAGQNFLWFGPQVEGYCRPDIGTCDCAGDPCWHQCSFRCNNGHWSVYRCHDTPCSP